MKRAFLTSSSGFDLMRSGLAEIVIPFTFRFVDGPPPLNELAVYVPARSGGAGPGRTGRTSLDAGRRLPKTADIFRWSSSANPTTWSNCGSIGPQMISSS